MDDQLFVPVWEGPYAEARERLTWLEEAHIPADLGDGLVPGQARVEVAPGYEADGRLVMARGPVGDAASPVLDIAPGSRATWPVWVAVGLVALLVLTLLL